MSDRSTEAEARPDPYADPARYLEGVGVMLSDAVAGKGGLEGMAGNVQAAETALRQYVTHLRSAPTCRA